MKNLGNLFQKLKRIKVIIACLTVCFSFFCTAARNSENDSVAAEYFTYRNISGIGAAESTLYQHLYYEINIPLGIIWSGNSTIDFGVGFLYPDNQVICAYTAQLVWVNADIDRKDNSSMVFKYKGFAFNDYVNLNLDYFFDYYRDVPEESADGNNNCNYWYWKDNNDFDNANDLFNAYVESFFSRFEDKYERFGPIPGRRHRYFNKDGVRVILFNILPENIDYFYSLTHSSLYVPEKEEFLRMYPEFCNAYHAKNKD